MKQTNPQLKQHESRLGAVAAGWRQDRRLMLHPLGYAFPDKEPQAAPLWAGKEGGMCTHRAVTTVLSPISPCKWLNMVLAVIEGTSLPRAGRDNPQDVRS